MFGCVLNVEMKGSPVCPMDADRWEKPAATGWANRGWLVFQSHTPRGESEEFMVLMNLVQSH